jgi:hypothetical protein
MITAAGDDFASDVKEEEEEDVEAPETTSSYEEGISSSSQEECPIAPIETPTGGAIGNLDDDADQDSL